MCSFDHTQTPSIINDLELLDPALKYVFGGSSRCKSRDHMYI